MVVVLLVLGVQIIVKMILSLILLMKIYQRLVLLVMRPLAILIFRLQRLQGQKMNLLNLFMSILLLPILFLVQPGKKK